MKSRYPCLEVNLFKLRENITIVKNMCDKNGIKLAGVIKGFSGFAEAAKMYEDAGVDFIASSRLEQLEQVKAGGVKTPCMCIRIAMLSELERLVHAAEYSLQSEIEVLKALDKAVGRKGTIHNVILMVECGDLREGFWSEEELVEAALLVENDLPNLYLAGVGVNVGCYGSVNATNAKLQEFVDKAELVEKSIGRKLDILSGGGTSSLPRILDGDMPERVNMLRVGEGIAFGKDMPDYYFYDIEGINKDVFILKAEVVEVKRKPTHPIGELVVDAFGNKPVYEDRGIRNRALVAIGRVDYGDPFDIEPVEEGIKVLGASSDHTILDIEDAGREIKVGDVIEFGIRYSSSVYLTNSPNVRYVFY